MKTVKKHKFGTGKKVADFFRVFFLVIFSILLTAGLLVFCITYTAKNTLLDSKFVKAESEKHKLYAIAEGTLVKIAETSIGDGMAMLGTQATDEDNRAIKDIARKAILSLKLQTQIDQNINSGLDYVTDKTDQLNLQLDISQAKTIIKTDLIKYAENKYGKQSIQAAILAKQLDSELSKVPDVLTTKNYQTVTETNQKNNFDQSAAGFKARIAKLNSAYIISMIAIIVLISLMFLLCWNLRNSLRWIGIPMLFVGVTLILISVLVPSMLATEVAARTGGMDMIYLDSSGNEVAVNPAEIVSGISADVFGVMFRAAIIFAILGAVLITFSFFVGKNSSKKEKVENDKINDAENDDDDDSEDDT